MSQQMMVFVSHSHEDDAFCRAVVDGLRGAGTDVWYDEHNLGSGQLMAVIQRELGQRPIVLVILSKAAFASTWVRREVTWAYELLDRDPTRLILPVTGGPIERNDFDPMQGWLFLHDFKRIEAPGLLPYPPEEAVRRLLHALALTPAGEVPVPVAAPQPTESVEDLLTRGKALLAQEKYAEALPLFQRATQLMPGSFDAWINLGRVLDQLKHPAQERLDVYDRALTLDPTYTHAWNNKGNLLDILKRYQEALAAYDQALTLDPTYTLAWNNKGNLLYRRTRRYDEALAAYDQAISLEPNSAYGWNGKGDVLYVLERYDEALAAYDQAISLEPNSAYGWSGKGNVLNVLKRYQEAVAAYDQALTLDPNSAYGWSGKALPLRALGRTAEAEAAERRAEELGG